MRPPTRHGKPIHLERTEGFNFMEPLLAENSGFNVDEFFKTAMFFNI